MENKIIERQNDLIKALSKMIDWDNYPTDRLDEYYELLSEINSLKEQSVTDDTSDTKKCKECGGRTALITGSFYYEPDAEPYENGIEEEAKAGTGECWVGGYKCDDCGNIQGLWHE